MKAIIFVISTLLERTTKQYVGVFSDGTAIVDENEYISGSISISTLDHVRRNMKSIIDLSGGLSTITEVETVGEFYKKQLDEVDWLEIIVLPLSKKAVVRVYAAINSTDIFDNVDDFEKVYGKLEK